MSKPNTPTDSIDMVAAQALLGNGQSSNPIANQLFGLLARKYQKELEVETETEERSKKARLMGAHAMEHRRQIDLLKQSQCPHIKPDRASALVGQRDHSNRYLFICQICSAEWIGNAVPGHLRISADKVGGPNF